MRKNRRLAAFISIVLALLCTSCSLIPTAAPVPTATLLPTYTSYPIYTPFPTATLVPTETPTEMTPTAAPTKKPYIPPAATKLPVKPTAVQQDEANNAGTVPVTWTNDTSHSIKVTAKGPANYTVLLSGGETKDVGWIPGDYVVKYYLDGSNSSSGEQTVTVDEEHAIFTVHFN
jgi:hypothetical protein